MVMKMMNRRIVVNKTRAVPGEVTTIQRKKMKTSWRMRAHRRVEMNI
jgi:hypothetical protein